MELVMHSPIFRKQKKPQKVHEIKAVASSFMETADFGGKLGATRIEMAEIRKKRHHRIEVAYHMRNQSSGKSLASEINSNIE
jgi:hypothetical protein